MGQPDNLQRMIALATEIFDARHDPQQLDVNESVIEKLKAIHPSTLSEYRDKNGPAIWILLIPTTEELMNRFIKAEISEKELLDKTPLNIPYTALYLCSAMALPEFRGRGLAKELTLNAIKEIRKTNPIRALFVWPFTSEGNFMSEMLSKVTGLPLYKRKAHII